MPERLFDEHNLKFDGEPSVLLTKYIALEGTALIAKAKEKELSGYFHPDMIKSAKQFKNYLSVEEEERIVTETAVVYTAALKEGGLLAALWDITEKLRCGMDIDLKSVPVKQETIEICEYFGLNPYELLSGGSLLIVTHEERKVLNALKSAGVNAEFIGNLHHGSDRLLWHNGIRSFLNRPALDRLFEII